jgi:hypothetical protein
MLTTAFINGWLNEQHRHSIRTQTVTGRGILLIDAPVAQDCQRRSRRLEEHIGSRSANRISLRKRNSAGLLLVGRRARVDLLLALVALPVLRPLR